MHRAMRLLWIGSAMLVAAAGPWTQAEATAVESTQQLHALGSVRYADAATDSALAPSSAGHLLASSSPSSSEITLAGCQLAGFTLTAHLGPDPSSPLLQLLLDTTLPMLWAADSSIQCSRASNCRRITPTFAAPPESQALGDITTSYPDGSKWSGSIWAEPVEIRSSAGSATSSAATLPSLHFASLTSVLHSARGDFIPSGSCAAPLDASVTSYQGVAGVARGGGVGADAAVSVATASSSPGPAAEVDSLWEQIRTRATPALPSADAFTLSLCANSGRLWLGSPSSQLEHDRFFSQFVSQMRFVRMHAEYTGLYQIDIQSLTVQPRLGSPAPQYPNATVRLQELGVNTVLDSAASQWIMPGLVYDTVQALLASDPDFLQAFPNLDPNWWIDRVCLPAAVGFSALDLYHRLPRLVLMIPTLSGGLGLSVPAVGSYLVPCDAQQTMWAAGITRRDEVGSNTCTQKQQQQPAHIELVPCASLVWFVLALTLFASSSPPASLCVCMCTCSLSGLSACYHCSIV